MHTNTICVGFVLAGVMGALAVLNSLILICRHLSLNRHTALRTYTVRILLIVPVYVAASCTALWGSAAPVTSIFLRALRELYESVVIFSFLQFILVCSGGPEGLIARFALRDHGGDGGPSQKAAQEDPACSMTVQNVDTAALAGSSALAAKFSAAVERTIAENAGVCVELAISAGRIVVRPAVPQPAENIADGAGGAKPAVSSTALAHALTLEVGNIAGMEAVSSGPVHFIVADIPIESPRQRPEPPASPANLHHGGRELKHVPLLSCVLPAWKSATQMLQWCVAGTLLFVLVGVGAALATFCIWIASIANHGAAVAGSATVHEVCNAALGVSSGVAIFCLAELAANMMEELNGLRPFGKFLSVKLIVFATFWQGLGLAGLKKAGVFKHLVSDDGGWPWSSEDEVCIAAINFLISVEMFAFSVCHFRVFPVEDSLTVLARLAVARDHPHVDANNMRRQDSLLDHQPGGSLQATAAVVDMRDIPRTAQLVSHVWWRCHPWQQRSELPSSRIVWHSQWGPMRRNMTWSGFLPDVRDADTSQNPFSDVNSPATVGGALPHCRSSPDPKVRGGRGADPEPELPV